MKNNEKQQKQLTGGAETVLISLTTHLPEIYCNPTHFTQILTG